MGLSSRMLLLDQDDGLFRLPNAQFDRMLRDPTRHPLLRFAGRRVRMADIVVECVARHPVRVCWRTFGILTFDEAGCLDPGALQRHQLARAELALAPPISPYDTATAVIDARTRFLAQGGRWRPPHALARRIDAAALDRLACRRPWT